MARYVRQVVSPQDGLIAQKNELPGLERVVASGNVVGDAEANIEFGRTSGAQWSAWRMGEEPEFLRGRRARRIVDSIGDVPMALTTAAMRAA